MERARARRPAFAAVPMRIGPGPAVRVCPGVGPGYMHCTSWVRTDIRFALSPAGYGPSDLQAAYALTAASLANGSSQTIAIVDAYDDPNAEADLGVYRSTFGLSACTTANGCFMKVNQNGIAAGYPSPDSGWAQEESLDLDMASAICPNCEIVLVEANSNSGFDLYAAEDTAATTCAATVISNSWDGNEYTGELTDEAHFNHPGVMITVSAGDSGYTANTLTGPDGYPVSSKYVTAVGGTTLNHPTPTTWSETVWSGSGSDCSAFIAQPTWQTNSPTVVAHPGVCNKRIASDVAAEADPSTGVAVYDSYPSGTWWVFGGTSVAAPIIASVYALAGNGASINAGSYSYSHLGGMTDITSGSNGSCSGTYLCMGEPGYDAPTGNGSPHGISGF